MIRVRQVVHRNEDGEVLGKVVRLMEPGLVVVRVGKDRNTTVFVEQDIQEHFESATK